MPNKHNDQDEAIQNDDEISQSNENTQDSNKEDDQDQAEKKSKGPIRRVIGSVIRDISPDRAIKSNYKLGYGREKGMYDGIGESAKGIFRRAVSAIYSPPKWDTIEEVEYDWGVNNINRGRVLRGMRVERNMWAVILIVVPLFSLYNLFTSGADNSVIYFFVAIISALTAFIKIYIAIWRTHVLTERNPVNVFEFARGVNKNG